ncbi:type II toxin-antitoxin system VapC family toxin [Pendulispora albinea]|uniref:Type II toxin-antitoxin system VapC family toxin n=1 Tax=Pendulispora albinea TaxID=2741071 RepID=A0ABZ2LN18_9BACT
MGYLLDTCILSEFTKTYPAAAVDDWLERVPDASQFVSVLTLGEIEKGIQKLPASTRRRKLELWLTEIRTRFQQQTLPIDERVAIEWGRISARAESKGHPLPVVDTLIAATAIVYGLSVVTRNTADMMHTGATIIDPWESLS